MADRRRSRFSLGRAEHCGAAGSTRDGVQNEFTFVPSDKHANNPAFVARDMRSTGIGPKIVEPLIVWSSI